MGLFDEFKTIEEFVLYTKSVGITYTPEEADRLWQYILQSRAQPEPIPEDDGSDEWIVEG